MDMIVIVGKVYFKSKTPLKLHLIKALIYKHFSPFKWSYGIFIPINILYIYIYYKGYRKNKRIRKCKKTPKSHLIIEKH